MVSPGRPMTRLMKSRSGSSGYLNTITSPRRGSLTGSTFLPIASGVGPKTNLLTSRWSPISRLFSIDPVGILKACTTHVRTNSARITAMTIDSKYSRRTDFLKAADSVSGLGLMAQGAAGALHPFLAFLLLLEQLPLARDVAAVALRQDVLPQRLHGFPRNHAAADRRLDRDLEHLARDQLAHLRRERAAA